MVPGAGADAKWLLVVFDLRRGVRLAETRLAPGTLRIGRDPSNDLVIDDASVSRRHALLHVAERIEIEDLGSGNGVRLVGWQKQGPTDDETEKSQHSERSLVAGERAPLATGQVMQLGSVTLVLQEMAGGDASTSAPARGSPVFASARMRALVSQAREVAQGDLPVLILGETGVGKELFAETVHHASPRAARALLKLNCAAMPEQLLESELFGYERGAFTGAVAAKPGLLEQAQGGTVFLDEVGELPSSLQVKLLRVLEERAIRRLGALRARPIDVRYIAATNRDLQADVAAGRFRADLYYRVAPARLVVPPLRERRDDIEPLSRHFLAAARERLGRPPAQLRPETLELLWNYPWPGNVRELKGAIERAALVCRDEVLPEHVAPAADPPPLSQPTQPPPAEAVAGGASIDELRERLREAERQRIVDALDACGGNQTRAAKQLGISRQTLIARVIEYDLPRPRK